MYKSIDIFSETVVTDWNKVKADGVVIAYIKATDGLTYINTRLDAQYQGAKSVGILVGFYHFAEKNSPIAEYQHFMSVIGKYKQDIKPSLDYEVDNPNISFVKQFMAQNSNLILYASHSVADISGLPVNRIWIAEPNTNPSSTRGYAGIQDSWVGKVAGISNAQVDIDMFDDDILLNGAVATSTVQPSNTGSATVRTIQTQLNTLLKCGLVVDGFTGTLTDTKIKYFQGIMGLTQDGVWGANTVSAVTEIYARPLDWVGAPHLEYATRYIQFRVGGGKDKIGSFSTGTALCLGQWQHTHGLDVDDKCGGASWAKMLDENC